MSVRCGLCSIAALMMGVGMTGASTARADLFLSVSPGDFISCVVCAPYENTHGLAIITNVSTNETAAYGLEAPGGTAPSGHVAEWVTEDPSRSVGGPLFPLPNLGQVYFTQCTVGSATVEIDLLEAHMMVPVDAAASPRAEAHCRTDSALHCQVVR